MIKINEEDTRKKYKVVTFYTFTPLSEEIITELLEKLLKIASLNNVMGSILVASEGLNGTICGSVEGVKSLLQALECFIGSTPMEIKISWTNEQAFHRFKARRKKEIVTMGIPEVDPRVNVGSYVKSCDWNEFLDDSDTLIIDTRNKYEIAIGSFAGSINPFTNCFREFPIWVEKVLHPLVKEKQPKRIAMFCTGGIRCEKATSFLQREGFENVHHLQGGILRYLEEVSESESLWEGELFVFDQRVALNHRLLPGDHKLCHACGMPLSPQDREHSSYLPGIQCSYCEDLFEDKDRVRFAERQRQYDQRAKQFPEEKVGPMF